MGDYLFAAAAVIVVLLCRKVMLTREEAVTEVLMPDEGQPSARRPPAPADRWSPAAL